MILQIFGFPSLLFGSITFYTEIPTEPKLKLEVKPQTLSTDRFDPTGGVKKVKEDIEEGVIKVVDIKGTPQSPTRQVARAAINSDVGQAVTTVTATNAHREESSGLINVPYRALKWVRNNLP